MELFHKIISTLEDGDIMNVTIGLFFTAVTVSSNGQVRCGLAATLSDPALELARLPVVTEAGRLEGMPARELAGWIFSNNVTEASVGMATINALLPPIHNPVEQSAMDYILRQGAQSQVAMIGHFPFSEHLKPRVKKLWVLELNPQQGDLPASAAPEVIPQADILAITATTLINHTFDGILRLRKPGARVLLLGPSTPLTPILGEVGVNVLSGSMIDDTESVVTLVRQAATFRQIHPHGVRLVTMELS